MFVKLVQQGPPVFNGVLAYSDHIVVVAAAVEHVFLFLQTLS